MATVGVSGSRCRYCTALGSIQKATHMKTAKTLGLAIPQSLLLRADQIIE
jgi:hypothetical protein